MLGALSIVRFRTPIRTIAEMSSLFLSITVGLVSAAGIFYILTLSIGITIISLFYFLIFRKNDSKSVLYIIETTDDAGTFSERFSSLSEKIIYRGSYKSDKNDNISLLEVTVKSVGHEDVEKILVGDKSINSISTLSANERSE